MSDIALPPGGFEDWLIARRTALAKNPELWQSNIMDPQKLWKLCKDRAVDIFDYKTIKQLWQAGIIRADIIKSAEEIKNVSLELLHHDNGTFVYLDKRKLEKRDTGYGGCLTEVNDNIQLFFHPFRFYVLYQVQRVFSLKISSTQYLSYPEGYSSVLNHHKQFFETWTATDKFPALFNEWNSIAETAIVLEPSSYHLVFSQIRWNYLDTQESVIKKLDDYEADTIPFISKDNLQIFEEMRKKLCFSVEEIDSNKVLHTLLRLTPAQKRENLKGHIGGAMHLLAMAETIRRAAEKSTKESLLEEDELGFGQWMSGAREILYGTERVLDAKREDTRDFLSEFNLDFGTKVRCYVEGETEIGALKHVIGDIGGIEYINLRGQVVAKQGKGLAFRDSLKNDLASKVFSVILIDSDRADYIRVLKKAAEEDAFTGAFYIAKPDFETSNFSLEELVEALLDLAKEFKIEAPEKESLYQSLQGTKSGKEFFKRVKEAHPALSAIGKGEAWGDALMKSAMKRGSTCPAMHAAETIARATTIKFDHSRRQVKVDPETGQVIKR